MTLLELLVKELPLRGGWPEDFTFAVQDVNGDVKFGIIQNVIFYNSLKWLCKRGYDAEDIWGDNTPPEMRNAVLTEDYNKSIVTREQYEAAIAAQQSVWNGEGLPPVGSKVESFINGDWRLVKVVYVGEPGGEYEALVFDIKTSKPAWSDLFRPIRSEADRKRDASISAMREFFGHASGLYDLSGFYDEIAAGKIPGVELSK